MLLLPHHSRYFIARRVRLTPFLRVRDHGLSWKFYFPSCAELKFYLLRITSLGSLKYCGAANDWLFKFSVSNQDLPAAGRVPPLPARSSRSV